MYYHRGKKCISLSSCLLKAMPNNSPLKTLQKKTDEKHRLEIASQGKPVI